MCPAFMKGKNNPEGVKDFGADDDTSVEYARDNNFYYIPGEAFSGSRTQKWLPTSRRRKTSLGRWEVLMKTRPNGRGTVPDWLNPDFYDWYETVKINYGIKPDGRQGF